MKFALVVLAMVLSVPAFAHLKMGDYKGTLADGSPCGFTAVAVSFTGGVQHPLNERVDITVDGQAFTLQHLPQVDVAGMTVAFEHGMLTGTFGQAKGATAAMIRMDHSAGHDGPADLTLVYEDYKDPSQSKKSVCGNLIAP